MRGKSILFLLFAAPFLHGQTISGNVVGTVQDASGAAVSSAVVEAANEFTGVKTSGHANAVGEYRLANLPAGSYTLSGNAAGFATASLKGVVIDVSKTATVNLTLQVGQVASTVEVTEASANIDTTTATIGSTFNSRESRDLPVSSIGLGAINLALLTAGVASNGGLEIGRGPSVGGQRPRNNNFTIEGVDNNNKSTTGALMLIPNDATQEFTLLQNQFSAEFGHSSGGQFNVIVKSGTNELHGSAYEYLQNRKLNALDQQFFNSGTLSNPRYDQNRFGGTVGGPIRHNKLFYFVNYEYNPTGQASTAGEIYSPTARGFATLAGISGLNQTNLGVFKQYATPAATPIAASLFPVVSNTPVEVGILTVAAPNYVNNRNGVASGDYNISDRDQLRMRYVYNNQVQLDHRAVLPAFYQIEPVSYHLATVSEFHNFSPAVTNELRIGFNRFISSTPAGDYKFPGLDAFPNLGFADLNGLTLGAFENAPQSASQNTYQLTDNLNWVHGGHTLTFGFDGRKVIAPSHFVQRSRGDYEYGTLDLYLHDISPDQVAQRTLGNPTFYGDQYALYGYVNDAYRYRPNLTFNLGVRYEYTGVPYSQRLQALNSVSDVPGLLAFRAPEAQKKNFAPRIGVAWSPGKNGTTSVRAGFGMAYDVLYDNIGVNAPPPQFSTTTDISNANLPNFLANGGISSATVPQGNLTPAQYRANTSAYLPDQKLPYSISWNFGVQHVFAKDYTLEVRYLGTRGVHLNVQERLNKFSPVTQTNSLPTYLQQPSQATLDALPLTLAQLKVSNVVPRFAAGGFTNSAFVEDAPIGNSTYHGLAVQLNKRFSRDLQFVAAYTWSHLIDDSTADFNTTALTPRRPQDFQNLRVERSSSALDHRHRLTYSAVYDVPLFAHSGAVMKNLLGNWSLAPVYTYESPEYVTVLSQIDSNLNGDGAADRTIINANGKDGTGSAVRALTSTRNGVVQTVGYLAIDPNAKYIQAGAGAYANGGRNTLAGRPINNIDFNILKNFDLHGERTKLQFSAQFYNLFNHAQFVPGYVDRADNPVTLNNTGAVFNYLTPGNANFNNPEAIYTSNPRNIQLTLKLLF